MGNTNENVLPQESAAAYRQTTDDEHTKTAPGHHVDLHPYLRAHRDAPPRDSRRREATLREGQGKEPPRRASVPRTHPLSRTSRRAKVPKTPAPRLDLAGFTPPATGP